MNDFSLISKVYVGIVFVLTCCVLVILYRAYGKGKPIVKGIRKNKSFFWVWTALLLVWTIIFVLELITNTGGVELDDIAKYILWIEICTINMLGGSPTSQICENGVFGDGYLYKWSSVSSYQWISDEVIEFMVKTRFQSYKRFEFRVDEALKPRVEDVLKKIDVR